MKGVSRKAQERVGGNLSLKTMKRLIAAFLVGISMMIAGCESNEPGFDISQLEGRCIKGRWIAGEQCTSFGYVQVLEPNIDTKSISVYHGKEYANVIRIDNFAVISDTTVRNRDLYFTVDTKKRDCAVNALICQQIIVDTPPSNVQVAICVTTISAAPCTNNSQRDK